MNNVSLIKIKENTIRLGIEQCFVDIEKYISNINVNNGFRHLIKEMSVLSIGYMDFVNKCFELFIAYSLAQYNPIYEKQYFGVKPDLTLENIDGRDVVIEIKKKYAPASESLFYRTFNTYREKFISILASKSSQAYNCIIKFDQVSKEYLSMENIFRNFQKLIRSINEIECIEMGEYLIYSDELSRVYLVIESENNEWNVYTESKGWIRDAATFNILKDILVGADSILDKFGKRKEDDIIIAVIDPRKRGLISGAIEDSFNEHVARDMIRNILDIDPRLWNNPSRNVHLWFEKIRKNIDVIALVVRGGNNILHAEFYTVKNLSEDKMKLVEDIRSKLNSCFNDYDYHYLA